MKKFLIAALVVLGILSSGIAQARTGALNRSAVAIDGQTFVTVKDEGGSSETITLYRIENGRILAVDKVFHDSKGFVKQLGLSGDAVKKKW